MLMLALAAMQSELLLFESNLLKPFFCQPPAPPQKSQIRPNMNIKAMRWKEVPS